MQLKLKYDTLEEIPEEYRNLYEKTENGYSLTGVEGLRTTEDVLKLDRALKKERADHAALKKQWKEVIGDSDVETVKSTLSKNVSNPPQNNENNSLNIEDLISQKLQPMKVELDRYSKMVDDKDKELQSYKTQIQQRNIRDTVLQSARKAKIVDTALEDVALLAEREFQLSEDGEVQTSGGLRVNEWMQKMKESRPHWWGASMGGGATGSSMGAGSTTQVNPWTGQNWNMTAQGQIYRQNPEAAARLAAEAGTQIGGRKPST